MHNIYIHLRCTLRLWKNWPYKKGICYFIFIFFDLSYLLWNILLYQVFCIKNIKKLKKLKKCKKKLWVWRFEPLKLMSVILKKHIATIYLNIFSTYWFNMSLILRQYYIHISMIGFRVDMEFISWQYGISPHNMNNIAAIWLISLQYENPSRG